ncbi:polysaccharide pyruvyl transferase family protein [Bacteroides graminisolvens]|uniref:polysaccharide pyruvyl transferase family protein n=1 Tax=Bacteroides graminisolvens TaxID=477666 RepID=UPI0023F3A52C|nr:polysaccharide pyruvyl transferase family protein [Bacteroides graminisolvens]
MKIGILTYYHDMNCGTTLQAFATLEAVRRVFPEAEVEIIPFRSFKLRRLPYKSEASLGSILRDARRIWGYMQFAKKFQKITEDYVTPEPQQGIEYIKSRSYDRIYVGADTLLELDRLPQGYDGLSAYWLSPDIPAKKYLLAASAKNVNYEDLTPKQKKQMQACVNSYSGMMVRDTATYELLSHFADAEKIQMVPDPTFTLQIDYSYAEQYVKKRGIDFSNVICFHPLKGETWCAEVADKLRVKGYKVACFRPAKWADYDLNDMSPLEQLGIYHHFKCMVTHRFHDSVFCLKNGEPVVTYPASITYKAKKGGSKYSALYDLFGLTNICYVEKVNELSPDKLIDKILSVVEHFEKHRNEINAGCKALGEEYIDKLEKTK